MTLTISKMNENTKHKIKFSIKDITLVAILAAILFVQEEAFSFIPNVQLTVFILVLYSKKLGFSKTTLIICIHVALDNAVMGSFNLFYTPAMFLGWMFIPITICTLGGNIESPIVLAVLGALLSFIYCWMYIIPNVILLDINPIAYLITDILWEVILAGCSFLSILWLYKPCSKLFDRFYVSNSNKY